MSKIDVKGIFKKKKVWLVVAVVAVAVAGCKVLGGNSADSNGMPVSSMPVVQKDINEIVALKAPLEGTEVVEIVSNLHYEVTQINVKEGDQVTKGQVLAGLDAKAMADELGAAEDALALAQSQYEDGLKNAQVAYDQAAAQLSQARAQFDRSKALYDAGALSQEQFEKDQHTLNTAQSAVDAYTVVDGKVQGSESERKNIQISRNALERKREELSGGKIISPIDGTVTRVNIKQGRFADETDDKKPMFVVENLDQLQMKVSVSEYDIAKVKEGQEVIISADILGGDTVKGEVSRISPTGEEVSGSTERIIPTIITVTESNDKLIAGITAKAEIQINSAENVLAAPLEAIVENDDGSTMVYKIDNGTAKAITVTLGLENDLEVEVTGEGLAEGDLVILNPQGIVDGMPVVTM